MGIKGVPPIEGSCTPVLLRAIFRLSIMQMAELNDVRQTESVNGDFIALVDGLAKVARTGWLIDISALEAAPAEKLTGPYIIHSLWWLGLFVMGQHGAESIAYESVWKDA